MRPSKNILDLIIDRDLKKDLARFWSHVTKGAGCWEWDCSRGQYGTFYLGKVAVVATRFIFAIKKKEPGELHVLHTCDNPRCVRPSHLFLGTVADNMRDRDRKCRRAAPKGEKNGEALLTEEQVIKVRAHYTKGNCNLHHYAQKYGVSYYCIWSVVKRKNWRHLP